MLVPASRAPCALSLPMLRMLLSSTAPLALQLFRLGKTVSGPEPLTGSVQPVEPSGASTLSSPAFAVPKVPLPRAFSLIGLRNNDRLVGSTTLHYVLSRNISGLSTKNSSQLLFSKPMVDPHGSVLRALEPEFLKIGFTKILENEHSMAFSDDTIKVVVFTDQERFEKLTMSVTQKYNRYVSVWRLKDKPDSLEAEQQSTETWSFIQDKINLVRRKIFDETLLFKPMVEPFGSAVKVIQPELLITGFFKIHEDEYSVTFSDGLVSVLLATDRDFDAPLKIIVFKKNGPYFSLEKLQEQLDSPETRRKQSDEWSAIVKKYGLAWNDDTPKAVRNEGDELLLSLKLKQAVEFFQTHKKTLSELTMDEATERLWSASPGSSRKIEPEPIFFQPLWKTKT